MEVTHHSDYDTHAIMGGGATQGFGIINSAEFITVLSSTLYSEPYLAVIREVICNAWDAHKMVGKEHIPVEVELDQTNLIIRDFGPGIDPKKMIDIYCTYGGSTKKAQENQTGGFGLGSKSPFAYTTYFTVTVNYGGQKTIWAISRGSSETKGMPDARPIITVPTEDTGVEVSIPLNIGDDANEFRKLIEKVVSWGEMNVTLNGKAIHPVPMSKAQDGILFTNKAPPSVNGLLYVRYGNVVYPIPIHREYETLYDGAKKLLDRTANEWAGSYDYRKREPLNAIFEAEPNTISITPSRESIHTSDRTIATVKGMLQRFINAAGTLGSPQYVLKKELEIMEEYFSQNKDSREFLLKENPIKDYYSNREDGRKYKSMDGFFFSIEEVVIAMAANGFIYNDPEVLALSRMQRLNYAIKHDSVDQDLLIKFKHLVKRDPTIWERNYSRHSRQIHFTNLLARASSKKLNPKNFILWDRDGYGGRKSYAGNEVYKTTDTFRNLLAMTRRVVMLVDSKGQITNHKNRHLKPVPGWAHVPEEKALVYVMPGVKKWASYEETLSFLKKQGFLVIDLVDFYKKYYPPVKATPVPAGVVVQKAKVFKKKKDSFALLTNLLDENGNFDMNLAKAQFTEDTKMTSDFEFVVKGENLRKNDWRARFFPFRDNYATFIVKEYGSKTVYARNIIEYQKAIKAGAKDLVGHIYTDVPNKILADTNLRAYLSLEEAWSDCPVSRKTYNDLIEYTKVGSMLPAVPKIDKLDLQRYEFFRELSHRRSLFMPDALKLIDQTVETLEKWEKDKSFFDPKSVFSAEAEKRLEYIGLHNILIVLKKESTEPQRRAFLETLLVLTLF